MKRKTNIVLILALALFSTSCITQERGSDSVSAIKDSDLPAISRSCDEHFTELEKRLNLASYHEHLMEGGDGIDDTYRYDLGRRWLFVEVHMATGHINRMYFAPKSGRVTGQPNTSLEPTATAPSVSTNR